LGPVETETSAAVKLPDEIVVFNHASVSTLRSITGKIVRSGTAVHKFHFNIDVPPGDKKTVKGERIFCLQ
jgi:hypothetical protein